MFLSRHFKEGKLSSPGVYGAGMLGISLALFMYGTYFRYYYFEELHLSASFIAWIMVAYTIWDAVTDPVAGYLSDRTRNRLGRRRPWLFAAAPLFAVFCIMLFAVPGSVAGNARALPVYFALVFFCVQLMDTLLRTNYFALFPELFVQSEDRARANSLRQALQLIGMIAGISLIPILAGAIGWSMSAALVSVIGMGLIYVTVIFSREDPGHFNSAAPKLRDSLAIMFKNRNFWSYSLATLFYQGASAVCLGSIPFFVRYALNESETGVTVVTGIIFVLAIPLVFAWSKISLKFGALKTWRLSLLLFGLAFVPLNFTTGLGSTGFFGAFIGIGLAGIIATMDLIVAKIIDEDHAATGEFREAMYQSVISFIIRLANLFGSLAMLLGVWIYGFESAESPGDNPAAATRMMLAVIPPILMLGSFLFSFLLKFKNGDTNVKSGETQHA